MAQVRILAIGSGAKELALSLAPDAIVDEAKLTGKKDALYDGIVSVNALNTVEDGRVEKVLASWKESLRPGGELHLFVRSLEWAAEQILAEDPSPLLQRHLFGDGEYKSGFTMRRLRSELARVDLPVLQAAAGEYEAQTADGVFVGEQHYVLARKRGSNEITN